MEALGGATHFHDRFLAQHLALAYYWYCVLVYLIHPRAAYHLSELVEEHAFQTYDRYVKAHEAELKKVQDDLAAVIAKVEELQRIADENLAEKQRLQDAADTTSKRLARAGKLAAGWPTSRE